jgi:DNA invertase Pin-like site-specific DNA recombinase
VNRYDKELAGSSSDDQEAEGGMKAALYARVSTTQHGQDVELQLQELRSVAQQRGWTTTDYSDVGISGATRDRPALDRLMSDARAGKFQIVAVWRFDRFARSTAHLIQALEEFRHLGIHFLSLRDQVDTSSPIGRVMFTITAAFAELEREVIQERVRAGVQRARAAGKHCGRPRKRVSDQQIEVAQDLLSRGWGQRQVEKTLGVNRSTLARRLGEVAQKSTVVEGV